MIMLEQTQRAPLDDAIFSAEAEDSIGTGKSWYFCRKQIDTPQIRKYF